MKTSLPRVATPLATTTTIDRSTYCLLCAKHFVSSKNLKRHANYAHKLCEQPAYVCDQCHTGFCRYEDYEKHYSDRLLKIHSRKIKRRKLKAVKPAAVSAVEQPSTPEPLPELKLEQLPQLPPPLRRAEVLEPFFDNPFFGQTSLDRHSLHHNSPSSSSSSTSLDTAVQDSSVQDTDTSLLAALPAAAE